MLVELRLVEQRYQAVLEVLNDSATVTDVARRYGVARQILYWLAHDGVVSLPGRTSVDRCLTRHGLITAAPRRRKRSDYRRWERSAAMELVTQPDGAARDWLMPKSLVTPEIAASPRRASATTSACNFVEWRLGR